MSKDLIADQAAMMRAFGQTVDIRNTKQAKLYLRMHLEELRELMVAANPERSAIITHLFSELTKVAYVTGKADIVEVFDGVLDCAVINLGVGLSMGFPMQDGWDEVNRTNVAKVSPETGLVIRNAEGKVQKPPGWTKPDLATILWASM